MQRRSSARGSSEILKGIRILMRGEPVIVFDDVQTRATRLIRGA